MALYRRPRIYEPNAAATGQTCKSVSSLNSYKILQSQSFGDLAVHATEYYAGRLTEFHSHQNARIVLVVQGQFEEHFGQKSRECSASSLIFRPAGEIHREKFLSRRSLCISLDIGPQWMQRIRHDFVLKSPLYFQSPFLASICFRLSKELQTQDSFSELVVEALLTEMLVLAARNQFVSERPYPVWLKRVLELLMSTTQHFQIRELALEAGIHPVHLARVFRRYHGCTMSEYVRNLRVQQSQQDLLYSNQPIAEIAIKHGFADQSHFTRSFKSVTGVTPARYRSQHCF